MLGSASRKMGMQKHRTMRIHKQPMPRAVKAAVQRFVLEVERLRQRRPRGEFYASVEALFRAERSKRKAAR